MVKKIYLLIVLLILLPAISAKLNVDITVANSFQLGDDIKFGYTISSDMNQKILYVEEVYCPEVPSPLLFPIAANVGPGLQVRGNYTYLQITEEIQPQTCTANIRIISPTEEKFEKNFTIDALPALSYKNLFCKDFSCVIESKVFLLNENIYFSYVSDAVTPLITATLTYPDGKTKPINIPSSIIAEQIGTYTIEITASKEGYKTITTNEQFGVIEKSAEIKTVSPISATEKPLAGVICNNDEMCFGEETAENCPSDCKNTQKWHNTFLFIFGVIIITMGILLIVFILKKKKH